MTKSRIQHQRTRQYHYDQASVGDVKSDFSSIKQPLPEKTVTRDQADVTRWALSKPTGERYKKVKVLDSEDVSETLYKLLKQQVAPEVDIESLDGNVLNYHYFIFLFKEVVESKAEDPRGRLLRLLKYTSGIQRTHQPFYPVAV